MVSAFGESTPELISPQSAQRLIRVGIALSAETDLDQLLELIVREARSLTEAEGGSLYIREGDELTFVVSQNACLDAQPTQARGVFQPFRLPLQDPNHPSIAAYVALTGQPLNIPDVYDLPPAAAYHFSPAFDQLTGYRTKAMLTIPLRQPQGQIVGALQLINCARPHAQFSPTDMALATALASQAAVAYSNVQLTQQLHQAHFDTIMRLSVAAEYRDQDTSHHLQRMSLYSRILAKHLGLSKGAQELILQASPMHDVGKIGIPDAILLKPGPLTPEERVVMQHHTLIGAEILGKSSSQLMQMSAAIALTHHEKFDGTGYPRQLAGEAIPIEGRIVALADVFDALASKRVYKDAWDLREVLEWVAVQSGKHFDPQVVQALHEGYEEILAVHSRYHEPDLATPPASD